MSTRMSCAATRFTRLLPPTPSSGSCRVWGLGNIGNGVGAKMTGIRLHWLGTQVSCRPKLCFLPKWRWDRLDRAGRRWLAR